MEVSFSDTDKFLTVTGSSDLYLRSFNLNLLCRQRLSTRLFLKHSSLKLHFSPIYFPIQHIICYRLVLESLFMGSATHLVSKLVNFHISFFQIVCSKRMMHDSHVVMLAWTISNVIQLDITTDWVIFIANRIGMEQPKCQLWLLA